MWNKAIKAQINDKLLSITIKINFPIAESLKTAMAHDNVIEKAERCWVFDRGLRRHSFGAECF